MVGDDGAGGPRSGASGRWRLLPLILIGLGLAAVYASGLHRHLTLDAVLAQRADWRQAVEARLVPAALLFLLVYTAVVALMLPIASLLTVLGGFLFGTLLGGTLTVAAATMGAVLVFLAARSALGAALERRAGPRLAALLAGFRADAPSYLLALRLTPVFPFWLVNLAAALGGVGLPVFAWTTAVGIVPGTFAFASFGTGLDSVVAAQAQAQAACRAAGGTACAATLDLKAALTPQLLLALVLLGAVSLIPLVRRRISR